MLRLLIPPVLLFLLIPFESDCSTDSLIYSSHVYNEDIKTVQLFREGWNLSYPILKLDSNDKLVLHFDLLKNRPGTFFYTFIHCSKDWTKTDIFQTDYLEGFGDNEIEDHKSSFNTTVSYIHYSLTFPNDRVRLKISGNYIIMVYPEGDPGHPVITQRFMVTENAAKIDANVHRPQMTTDNNTRQQVDFTVNLAGLSINDPQRNIYAFILQNGRWDNAKKDLKADFYGNNELKYSSISEKNIFLGGNEYRYFDIKSLKYQSEFIRRIDFAGSSYHIFLHPSENREFKPYFYSRDFNGKYFIASQEGRDPDTDADYVYVYFSLPSSSPVQEGNIYIYGALSNWSFGKSNLMSYNPEKRQYECTMLLKQGWYNYDYKCISKRAEQEIPLWFEGSHYETENDYLVIIYYRNPRERFDRVTGTITVNTLNRLTE
jgi:hypothetical protein